MLFAQFYTMSTGYVAGSIPPVFSEDAKKPIEACGDRGIIIIDGRLSAEHRKIIAEKTCKERGYIGYTLHKGETFSRSVPITEYKAI